MNNIKQVYLRDKYRLVYLRGHRGGQRALEGHGKYHSDGSELGECGLHFGIVVSAEET